MTTNPILQFLPSYSNTQYQVSLLRLDQLHPVVSGNKWYKLRFYIQEAIDKKASSIVSFGGPYSNHLVALAYAAHSTSPRSLHQLDKLHTSMKKGRCKAGISSYGMKFKL